MEKSPYAELTDSVEELLKRIAEVDSPDIKSIRAKVQVALATAKSAWQETTSYASRQVTRTLRRPGDYVRQSPLRTIGIAALLGIGVGALLARPRSKS